MTTHQIATQEQWLAASRALVEEEKFLSRLRDQLNEKRRALPWVRLEKNYVFESTNGPVSLAGLFEGRSQLAIYHFMFAPDWDEGCTGCSLLCDHVDGARQHFEHNGLGFAAVSRAPLAKLQAYRARMGWQFRWVSSAARSFNYDFNVSFPAGAQGTDVFYNFATQPYPGIDDIPGVSMFFKDADGTIYHTYSSFSRGTEILLGVYGWLDMAPLGRNETGNGNLMDWVKRHDQYEIVNKTASCRNHA